ncbi:MAG: hypothetical protein FWG96_02565 [Methanomassiliicoccaceae archaeon]|nr:hypothetical protein [Methanomassiliicoccaceae archaeon]
MKKSVMIIIAVVVVAAVVLVAAYFTLWNDKDENNNVLSSTSPGHYTYTYDGIAYDLEIPNEIKGLVLDVHGMTMDADQENDGTNLREIGPKYGYVILQPSTPTRSILTDYDARLFEMVNIVVDELGVDTDRIHVTGFSNGGRYTWRTVLDHSDFYASAAPAASGIGTLPDGCTFSGDEMPEYEIPILYMYGTQDSGYPTGIVQRDAVIAAWNMGAGVNIATDSTYTHTRYTNANGTVFEFISHDYASNAPFELTGGLVGGHCFPGSTVYYDPADPKQTFACEGANSFIWGEELMKFFIAHPKS